MGLAKDKAKTVIGRSEKVSLPELGISNLPARIDTGAGVSAIWADSVAESADGLEVVFLGPENPAYTGAAQHFTKFGRTEVRSSNGHSQVRYTIRTLVLIGGRKIRAEFTLADRSSQLYPVLIGRNILRGKFVVDVKLGSSLPEEQERKAALKAKYGENPKE
ncbi:MAG TPA: RimK/LysX family protein [Candidatus Saccharimonadales bacterium]|nr:RimK/LysX family protein [Candidatus Saccharimonadales bacterium]